MSHNSFILMASMTTLLCCVSTNALAQNSNIGVNAAIKGDVTVQTAEEDAKQAVVKDKIYLGQRINAQKLSSLQILLKDQTVFTVGPECEMTIDKYVYDPDKNNNTLSANVSKGMFRFMSGNVSKQGADAVTITTPVGSMGVRGTIVEGLVGLNVVENASREGLIPQGMVVDPNKATMFILRGPGKNNQGINRKGEITITSGEHTVTVKGSNQGVFIPSPGAKPIIFTPSLVTYQNFSNQIRTKPTRNDTYSTFEFNSKFDLSKLATNPVAQSQTGSSVNTATEITPKASGSSGAGIATGTGISSGGVVFGLGAIVGAGFLIQELTKDDEEPEEPNPQTRE